MNTEEAMYSDSAAGQLKSKGQKWSYVRIVPKAFKK